MSLDDVFKFKTENRTTKVFTVQGLDLVIEQKEKSSRKTVGIHHYSDPGYYSFGALVLARWYYGLDQEELNISHMEGMTYDAFDFPMMLLCDIEMYLEEINKNPNKREIFSVCLYGAQVTADLTLQDEGLEYKKKEGVLIIEKEITNECLGAIIHFGKVYGPPNEKFLRIYEHFLEKSKGYESPYASTGDSE